MLFPWSTPSVPESGFGYPANPKLNLRTPTVSADSNASTAIPAPSSSSSDFGRAAMAILATMVLLMVALTGILVQTTWRNPEGSVEVLPSDPGSFARR